MVCNFQYLTTCIAFSIAEPFRKPVWTNYPFFFCICCAIAMDVYAIFAPENSFVARWFDLLPFSTSDGTSYYSYRYLVALTVIFNSLLTYGAEKFILNKLTKKSDERKKIKKEIEFYAQMEVYRSLVASNQLMQTDSDKKVRVLN